MICPCGGTCREHEVIGPPAGYVVTCNACGRRELFPFKSREPEQANLLAPSTEHPTGERV